MRACLQRGCLCQEVSGEIGVDLEWAFPCTYRVDVATEHDHLRAIAYWRDLLARVADDIESTSKRETDVKRTRWLQSRSRRIRQLLAEPVPPGWSAMTSTIGRR